MILQKLKTLHTILGTKDFVLTGSLALAYHGLLEFSEAKDLDIILIKPDETAKKVLKNLTEANPSPKHKEGSPVSYSFIIESVKIDVWVVDSYPTERLIRTEDDIRISTIKEIVKAKKSYNRSKDWVQLMQLSRKIFNPNEFSGLVDSISNFSDEYPDA